MTEEKDKLYARLAEQEREIVNLRQGYVIVSSRHIAALASLKAYTTNATESIKRAAIAAAKAASAAVAAASLASELVSRAATEAAAAVAAKAEEAASVIKAVTKEAAAAAAAATAEAAAATQTAAEVATVIAKEQHAAEMSIQAVAGRQADADRIVNAASESARLAMP